MFVQVFLQESDFIFFGNIPILAGSYSRTIYRLFFLRIATFFSIRAVVIYISTKNIPFYPPAFVVLVLNDRSNRNEMVPHYDFELYFPDS
jgi:hypothetical protein